MKEEFTEAAKITIPFLLSSMVVYSLLYKSSEIALISHVPAYLINSVVSYSFYGGALGGVVLGALSDYKGYKASLSVSIAIYSILVMITPFLKSTAWLSALWFFVGFGVNAENGITYAFIVDYFRSSRATLGSFIQALYFIGMFIDSAASIVLRNLYVYFVAIGFASLLSLILILKLPDVEKKRIKRGAKLKMSYAALTIGSLLSFSAFLYTITLVTYAPVILGNFKTMVLSLVGFFGFLIFGYLSDKAGKERITVVLQLIGLTSLSLVFLQPSLFPNISALLYLATSYFGYLGVWLSELFPSEVRSTGVNSSLLIGRLIGGAGPLLVAYFAMGDLFQAYIKFLLIGLAVGLAPTLYLIYKKISA